jgi:hypothetical protein
MHSRRRYQRFGVGLCSLAAILALEDFELRAELHDAELWHQLEASPCSPPRFVPCLSPLHTRFCGTSMMLMLFVVGAAR